VELRGHRTKLRDTAPTTATPVFMQWRLCNHSISSPS
jgi:hypothetical protein